MYSLISLVTNELDSEHFFYFRYRSPSVKFCHGDVSADGPVKGTFLTLKTETLTICNGENCSVDDLLYSAACCLSNFITQSIFLTNGLEKSGVLLTFLCQHVNGMSSFRTCTPLGKVVMVTMNQFFFQKPQQ